jgi:3-methyladenine DNA glycosylase AlkD
VCNEKFGIILGVGLNPDPKGGIQDNVFRIGHMGHLNPPMILGTLGVIEAGLAALNVQRGSGAVDAAAAVLASSAVSSASHVKHFQDCSNTEVLKVLRSKYHEERLFALLLWVRKFTKANEADREKIVELYLANTKYINNWDLVDSSSYAILGTYLLDKSRQPLRQLAKSDSIWERRTAIIATYRFIKENQFKDTFAIATILKNDKEDLIHKAVGWMLREVGNRDRQAQTDYMASRYKKMPRTMLRYAIEKYPEKQRKAYLAGTIS